MIGIVVWNREERDNMCCQLDREERDDVYSRLDRRERDDLRCWFDRGIGTTGTVDWIGETGTTVV